MSIRGVLAILMVALLGVNVSVANADMEADIVVQQLLSSIERGDHTSTLQHVDRLRELTPGLGGEMLYVEAEAAHALGRYQRAHDAAYRYASEMGRDASRYNDAMSIVAAARAELEQAEKRRQEQLRLRAERERRARERYVDNGDGTFRNTATGKTCRDATQGATRVMICDR